MTRPVQLRGGSMAVDPDQLELLAVRVAAVAALVEGQVIAALLQASRPGPAAVLDPLGSAEVMSRSAGALTLAALVVTGCLALSGSLRTAAAAYRELDRMSDRFGPLLRAATQLPGAWAELTRGRPQGALVRDPELTDAGVQLLTGLAGLAAGGAGGLVPAVQPDASARLAGALGQLYPDDPPVVTRRPAGRTLDGRGAPRSVADLLRDVGVRECDDAGGGAVDVRVLEGPAGRRVIVDIGGTRSWDLNPLSPSGQASDFGTNLRALGNRRTVLSAGVRLALRQSGVGPDDPIMLVGHSQGGMVAAELADELNRDHEFTVTHVVTAGSPIGLAPLPSSISVLSLENRGDAVPELDGADNPARTGWLTARVDHGPDTILGRHSVDSYVAGAADFDADRDSAVQQWQSGAADYLNAGTVRTTVYRIGRS